MTTPVYKVLIVGCGNIAGGYDFDIGKSTLPCTHAGAYKLNQNFEIVACVEPNAEKRYSFMERWSILKGFGSLEEIVNTTLRFDVVSICSPTELHFEHVMLAIKLAPKLIFCEKPVASTAQEAKALIEACNKANILLAVNYIRRWDPVIVNLKQQLADGHYGKIHSVVGYYNKGILHNGSHMIDLLHYLLGKLYVIVAMESIIDLTVSDPTVTALLQSENKIPIHLVTGNSKDFALFELQLICSNGIFTMCEGGLYWFNRSITDSNRFIGYRELDAGKVWEGGCQQAMTRALENIYQSLTNGAKLASNEINAYQAQLTCEKITQLSKKQNFFKDGE